MTHRKKDKCQKLESQDDEAYVTGKKKPKEKGIEIPDSSRKVKEFEKEEEEKKKGVKKDDRE